MTLQDKSPMTGPSISLCYRFTLPNILHLWCCVSRLLWSLAIICISYSMSRLSFNTKATDWFQKFCFQHLTCNFKCRSSLKWLEKRSFLKAMMQKGKSSTHEYPVKFTLAFFMTFWHVTVRSTECFSKKWIPFFQCQGLSVFILAHYPGLLGHLNETYPWLMLLVKPLLFLRWSVKILLKKHIIYL